MFDLIYRFDPTGSHTADLPADAQAAIERLVAGNRQFARLLLHDPAAGPFVPQIVRFDADDLGLPRPDGSAPRQRPFAAVLGCSDARVPIEMVLGQACNDLFVIRVAGNVLGAECLGSLDYALTHLGDDLKLVVVLGHSGCGAVTAATDAFLLPSRYLEFASSHPLRSVVDRVLVPVRAAHAALETVHGPQVRTRPGYRTALIETGIALNAALVAATVRHDLADRLGDACQVVFGVYNLVSRRVKLSLEPDDGVAVRLAPPPTNAAAFDQFGVLLAGSALVRELLES
jgi:carbonic anhydrase